MRSGVAGKVRARERDVRSIHKLVDEEPIAHEQRRDHAARWYPERLHEQSLDHEVDQDGAGD